MKWWYKTAQQDSPLLSTYSVPALSEALDLYSGFNLCLQFSEADTTADEETETLSNTWLQMRTRIIKGHFDEGREVCYIFWYGQLPNG